MKASDHKWEMRSSPFRTTPCPIGAKLSKLGLGAA
jgi:hypothetical protein